MQYFDLVFKLAKTMLEHYSGLVFVKISIFLSDYNKEKKLVFTRVRKVQATTTVCKVLFCFELTAKNKIE